MSRIVFISGATGFIGSRLALRLAESDYLVHALYRSPEKAEVLKHKNIMLFRGDVCNGKSLDVAMENCTEAYHLGAFARIWHKDAALCHKVNVDGTINVLEAALQSGVEKIVVTSTAGVFGPSLSEPVNELSERTAPFFTSYEHTKSEMESEAQRFLEKGLDIVFVNPTRVFGPGLLSEANYMTKIIGAYLNGKWRILPGKGQNLGNYAFVEDVVEGHRLAMERGKAGERYILGGTNISFADLFHVVSNVTGKTYKMFYFPRSLMIGAAGLSFFISRVLGKPPRITPQWVRRYLRDWAVSSEKAERELGYRITPIEESIEKTVKWLEKSC